MIKFNKILDSSMNVNSIITSRSFFVGITSKPAVTQTQAHKNSVSVNSIDAILCL